MKNGTDNGGHVLVLGIGNVLMGDEGVGVHVVRHLESMRLPASVQCLDGGTGSFLLLEPLQQASRVVLIDATVDENPPGTVRRLTPRFSSDYPKTLTAHDIGLKDLLDAAYLMGEPLDVALFTISIAPPEGVGMTLSPAIAARIDEIARIVENELTGLSEGMQPRAGNVSYA